MKQKSMTALMCLFVKTYFSKNSKTIFKDEVSEKILTETEYNLIANHLESGIKFFNPDFNGTNQEAIDYITHSHLAPAILARNIFAEKTIQRNMMFGLDSCLVLGSGYDTIAYKNYKLNFYEFDQDYMIEDKKRRLQYAGIDTQNVNYIKINFSRDDFDETLKLANINFKKMSICLILGLCQYLSKSEFYSIIETLSKNMSRGSMILFDYITPKDRSLIPVLASGANEDMQSFYDHNELEKEFSNFNLLAYEHLTFKEADKFFDEYIISSTKNKLSAPKNTEYILFVKQ